MGVEQIVSTVAGIKSIYATIGRQNYTLNNQGGVPVDNIGRITVELKDFSERAPGNVILEEIRQQDREHCGHPCRSARAAERPADRQGRDDRRLIGRLPGAGADGRHDPQAHGYAAGAARRRRHAPAARHRVGSRRQPRVASRFGANAQTIGTAVQLVTDGILVGKYRPDDSDDEVDIRVRYPEPERGIHALDDRARRRPRRAWCRSAIS